MSCDQLDEDWDIITGNAKYQKSDIYYDSFCLDLIMILLRKITNIVKIIVKILIG